MAPVTIQLQHPITFGSQHIGELTFRPLKAKDLRRCKANPEKQPIAFALELAGYLTGQVTQVIDELEGEDIQRAMETAMLFFGASPEDGSET